MTYIGEAESNTYALHNMKGRVNRHAVLCLRLLRYTIGTSMLTLLVVCRHQ